MVSKTGRWNDMSVFSRGNVAEDGKSSSGTSAKQSPVPVDVW